MPQYTRDQLRRMAGDIQKNFNDKNLSDCDLTGLEFWQKPFKRAVLSGADLTQASFHQCEFKKADLSGADLSSTKFIQCEFRDAVLDGVVLEHAQFLQCDFKRATWKGVRVKEIEFSQCTNLEGLTVEKVIRGLWELDDDQQKRAICLPQLKALEPLLDGVVEERLKKAELLFTGKLQDRAFFVRVGTDYGRTSVRLAAMNRLGPLRLFCDPGREFPEQPPEDPDEADLTCHPISMSGSVFLEEDADDLETAKGRLARLPEPIRQELIALLEAWNLQMVELTEEGIEAHYRKEILNLRLADSVPGILDVFGRVAAMLETI